MKLIKTALEVTIGISVLLVLGSIIAGSLSSVVFSTLVSAAVAYGLIAVWEMTRPKPRKRSPRMAIAVHRIR